MAELKTKVKIKQRDGVHSQVFIDDKEVNNVTEVFYHHKAGRLPKVVITLVATMDVEEDMEVDYGGRND